MAKTKKLAMNRLLLQIVHLLIQHPLDKVTFAMVSRECKIPRSTLYYYFGSNRMTMINEAVRFGMSQLVAIGRYENLSRWKSWTAYERMRFSRGVRLMMKYPWTIVLYFRLRTTETPFTDAISTMEERYFLLASSAWKHFNGKEPPAEAARLLGYMKLGLFFGFASEQKLWKSPRNNALRKRFLDEFAIFAGKTLSLKP